MMASALLPFGLFVLNCRIGIVILIITGHEWMLSPYETGLA